MSPAPVLTPRAEDFPQWYQELLLKAELAENGPARGTMVIRPYGYAIWELMQAAVDARIKEQGADNVYFPLFIPEGHLKREAEHVEGFSPELAVVTHAGGKELTEPLVVRPTSETVFGQYMAKWIQSYRDLPLLLNQWANVVRWELRPRLFLRTSEFLWQEGHTAHETREDAAAYARRIHEHVYRSFLEDVLAIPVLTGIKTDAERFAGAIATLTCEGMMGDGKALQMATSHELGQNFSRAFEMTFAGRDGAEALCWTTSWGSSTRMVGGLIMAHGDDAGLRLPPRAAPTQVVVIAVRDDAPTIERVQSLVAELRVAGLRAKADIRVDTGLGRRLTDWELKGVPVRIQLGPRDLAAGAASVARRDVEGSRNVALDEVAQAVAGILDEMQAALLAAGRERLASRTETVGSIDEAWEAAQTGFASMPWGDCGTAGERALQERAVTVRCLQLPDGSVPSVDDDPSELVAIIARAY